MPACTPRRMPVSCCWTGPRPYRVAKMPQSPTTRRMSRYGMRAPSSLPHRRRSLRRRASCVMPPKCAEPTIHEPSRWLLGVRWRAEANGAALHRHDKRTVFISALVRIVDEAITFRVVPGGVMGLPFANVAIKLHAVTWHCLALSDIFSICSALLSTTQHCSALLSTAQHCTALHSTAQHCTALHSTAQHCTALHSTAQHCTALHCTA
jgi:hypothetical protein